MSEEAEQLFDKAKEEIQKLYDEASNAYYKGSRIIGRVNGTNTGIKLKLDFMETEVLHLNDIELLKRVAKQYIDMIRADLKKIEYEKLKTFMRTGKGF